MNNINQYLKPLAIALGLLAIYASYKAEAGTFVEVGSSHFRKPPNGVWWQDQYPSVFDLDGKYVRIGYGDESAGPLRLSYFNLGKYETEALGTEEEIRYFNGDCNASTCLPPEMYQTKGSLQGILVSHVSRGTFGYIEAGISYSRQTFELNKLNRDLTWLRFSDRQEGFGYMVGLGLEYKSLTISVNYFKNDKSAQFDAPFDCPGIDTVTTLALGYRF